MAKVEKLPLHAAVTHLLEECRMVLPGIQALFGFQLIVVFNQGFGEKLFFRAFLPRMKALQRLVLWTSFKP